MKNAWVKTMVIAIVLGFPAALTWADDPLQVAPTMYSLILENDRVRVMQVIFKPGEKIAKHSHPDHFAYVLEGGKLKISKPDGSSTENTLAAGQAMWIPAETHWAENNGATQVRLLVTELKGTAAKPAAKSKTP